MIESDATIADDECCCVCGKKKSEVKLMYRGDFGGNVCDRLKAQVMAKIAEAKAKALQAINDYENAIKDAGVMSRGDENFTWDIFADSLQEKSIPV